MGLLWELKTEKVNIELYEKKILPNSLCRSGTVEGLVGFLALAGNLQSTLKLKLSHKSRDLVAKETKSSILVSYW